MHRLLTEMRYALRQLRRAPGFALTAVFTLALGIGATSTILSWISSTLLNPIPGVADTTNMITIQRGERSEHASPPLSYPDFVDLRAAAKSFSGMLAYHDDYMSITGGEQPERLYGALTTADYFEVLGVHPILGRTLLSSQANEGAGTAEAVLGYDLWRERFGADPSVIGRTIQINLHPYTIVGVAPQGFRGCKSGLHTDIFIPLGMDKLVWDDHRIDKRGTSWLNVLAVMRPGVNAGQAERELNLLMEQIAGRYPETHLGDNRISTDPLWRSPFGANVYLSGTLPILLALAGVLLLLSCANVANLLLVRSVSRRREFAIRLSIGAGRWSMARQLMLENSMIAIAGGAVALAFTEWTAKIPSTFIPITSLPLTLDGSVAPRVMVATFLVALFAALLSGVVPAVRASNVSPASVLKDESFSTAGGLKKSLLSSGLVVMQVGLSLLLLACAGLFLRSIQKAQALDPGFDSGKVLLMTFDLDPMGYSDVAGTEFQRQVIARVSQLPAVQSAMLADFSPLSFSIHSDGIMPEGYVLRPHESLEADRGTVSSGYLKVMRTPLLAGREFNESDTANSQPVVIVNKALVDRYWPGLNPLGRRIQVSGHWKTVVGVAANAKYRRLINEPTPLVLLPLTQRYTSEVMLHVRTNGDPQAMAQAVQDAIHSLNANLPLYNVTTLKVNMQMGSIFERLSVAFAGSFGLLALLLAAVGLYAVVSYTAQQSTHEIGIRIALGASKGSIFRDMLKRGLMLTIMGTAAGLGASLILTRFLRSLLFGVGSADALTFVTVAALLCAVALIACFLPARRAASVDPMQALRTQ